MKAIDALAAFSACVASKRPPPFGTLTVAVFEEDDTQPDRRGAPARGVLIRAEGGDVGRTGNDGILTGQVPSGTIEVIGLVPPSELGYRSDVEISPSRVTRVSLVLGSGAQPAEDTDLILEEAGDEAVVQHTVKSLTFKFLRDDVLAPVADLEHVEIVSSDGVLQGSLATDLFTIRSGTVVATKVAAVMRALRQYGNGPVVLRVTALDAHEYVHSAEVRFRIE